MYHRLLQYPNTVSLKLEVGLPGYSILNIHGEFYLWSRCQTLVILPDSLYLITRKKSSNPTQWLRYPHFVQSGVPEKVNRFLTNGLSMIDEPNSLKFLTEKMAD